MKEYNLYALRAYDMEKLKWEKIPIADHLARNHGTVGLVA